MVVDGAGSRAEARDINVNHPLQFGGLTIFQSSYQQLEEGARARLRIVDRASGAGRELLIGAGEKIEAAEGLSYSMVDHRRTSPASARPSRYSAKRTGSARRSSGLRQGARRFRRAQPRRPLCLSFTGLRGCTRPGCQIARDPSTPIIYAGCFFLFAGCAIAFYTAHKRIWVRITSSGVEIGGAAHRNADAFRLEFEEICERIGLQAEDQGAARAA